MSEQVSVEEAKRCRAEFDEMMTQLAKDILNGCRVPTDYLQALAEAAHEVEKLESLAGLKGGKT